MHVVEKAASLVRGVGESVKESVSGAEELTVQLCNGTREEVKIESKTSTSGECSVHFVSLQPGQVGAIRLSGDGTFASSLSVSIGNCKERLSVRGARMKATGADSIVLEWQSGRPGSGSFLGRLSGLGSQVMGSTRPQRVAGATYAAVCGYGDDAGFDPNPPSAARMAGHHRATVLIAGKDELPAAPGSEAKAALGRHFTLSSLNSLQLMWFAEWVRDSQVHSPLLGCALFVAEYAAVLRGTPSMRPRDEAFTVDLLIEAFLASHALGAAGRDTLAAMYEGVCKERPEGLPALSAASYSDYLRLPDDRLKRYLITAHSLLRAAALFAARALKPAASDCKDLGTEGEGPSIGREKSSSICPELLNNAEIFKTHLERADSQPAKEASSASTGSSAGEDDIPALVKHCIGESAEHAMRRRLLMVSLRETLRGNAEAAAFGRYCDWLPAARREFRRLASNGVRAMRCVSYGDELFGNLDGGSVASPELLLKSLGPDSKEFKVLSTNSKSGEFFFFSGDARFLIKTVSDPEGEILCDMLPAYQSHLRNFPRSFIVRYAGLFRVEIEGGMSKYFTIMASVFDPACKVHENYDVKGSLHNRIAKEGESTGKDSNWFASKRRLKLPQALRRELLAAHEQDCALLSSFNVMDYSMLIGVHKLAEGGPIPQGSGARQGGGLWAEGDREIYFVGMIDFLIHFSFKKEAEHIIRTAQGHAEDASCVNPTEYALRQVLFVREKIFEAPEDLVGTVGTLRVSGMSARKLINADGPFDASDPYVQVKLGLQTAKTPVIKDNLNPDWKDAELAIPVHDHHRGMMLELTVWDAESNRALRGADDFLGRVVLPMESLLRGQATVDIGQKLEGVSSGELTARLTFTAA